MFLKKGKNYLILDLFILMMGIAVFVFMFLDIYKSGDTVYKGYEVAFGKTISENSLLKTKLDFSIWACLAFILPLLFGIVNIFIHGKLGFIGGIAIAVIFLFAALLFAFMTKELSISYVTGSSTTTKTFEQLGLTLTVYPSVATLCCAFGSGIGFASCFIK